jgi:carbon storage regulator
MLVLSRKVNEQIVIGNNIRMTVVSIRGNQVRLGFEAPQSVPIFRDELRHQDGHPVFTASADTTILHPPEPSFSDRSQQGLAPSF